MAFLDYLGNYDIDTPAYGGMRAGTSWATEHPTLEKLGLGPAGATRQALEGLPAAFGRSAAMGGGVSGFTAATSPDMFRSMTNAKTNVGIGSGQGGQGSWPDSAGSPSGGLKF